MLNNETEINYFYKKIKKKVKTTEYKIFHEINKFKQEFSEKLQAFEKHFEEEKNQINSEIQKNNVDVVDINDKIEQSNI